MCGYVCSCPVLWILESFWSWSWPPKTEAGWLLATCYICTWLVSLAEPRLLESEVLRIALIQALRNKNPCIYVLCIVLIWALAQQNPHMVRIWTLRITYTCIYVHVHIYIYTCTCTWQTSVLCDTLINGNARPTHTLVTLACGVGVFPYAQWENAIHFLCSNQFLRDTLSLCI